MDRREGFDRFKIIISIAVVFTKILPKFIRMKLLIVFRNLGGYLGILVRYCLLKTTAKSCGYNVGIQPNVFLFNVDKLKIGNNVVINEMCYIDANGYIDIGNEVMIAHGVTILSSTHNYDNIGVEMALQPQSFKKVTIEDDVWLGAKSTILYGRTVYSGSIVGANSVVTKDVPTKSVVCGIPAKVIKYRGEK